jgi:hypothetical protein
MATTKHEDGPGKRRIWLHRFEHKGEPLAARRTYWLRQAAHGGAALAVVAVALGVGVMGYRTTEHMGWLDAMLNAAMILGGMGPVDTLRTNAGKMFASFYSLFSGIVFLVAVGVMIAPAAHRLMHRLHLEIGSEK